MLGKIWRAIERALLIEAPATRLALLRIVLTLYPLYYLITRRRLLHNIGGTSRTVFKPVGGAAFLDAPISMGLYDLIVLLTIISGVLFLLGALRRVSGPLFALGLLFVLSYRNSWSHIYHSRNLAVVHIFILGFARSADALSIDAWLWRRFGRVANPRDPAGHWEYGWPVRLICAVTVITYFLAGVAKVAGPYGFSWAAGEVVRSQVTVDAFRKDLLGGQPSTVFVALYHQVWLFTIMGIGTLVLELGAPLVLFVRRLLKPWVVGAYGMHVGIYVFMDIGFDYYLSGLVFLSFFEIERLLPASWRSATGSPDAAVS